MQNWLSEVLHEGRYLTDEAEGYLLGRGMTPETLIRLGMTLWTRHEDPAPDEEFARKYQPRGDYLRGRIVCPCYSPRGIIIGFEARTWEWDAGKKITDYRLSQASWNPFFLGLTPSTMHRIWDGCDVWIVEGLFDLAPMERIVPSQDVVLATVRAKLSWAHAEFLRRYVRRGRVNLVYDNDETGRKQTLGWTDEHGKRRWGALEVLQRVGVENRDIPYRGGKDPGEIWDNGGEPALREAFSHVL